MDLSQESSIPPENLVFISTRSGGRRTQRLSRVAIVSSLVIFGALAPWTKIPLLRIDAFIPIYESAIIISDAITAVMLFGVFRILRSRSLWILATAYLLTASAAFIHLLTFPGLFSAGGLLGAGPQTTASLFVLWHGIFPVAVVGFVLLKKNDAVQSRASLGWSLGAGAFIFAGILTLATAGNQWLPLLIVNNHLTPTMTVLTSSELVIGGVGAWMLWRQKSPPVLDRWLLVAALASLIEIALSSTLDGGRFDLGFYSGRIYGLIASSLVLWVLLLEHSSLYGQLQSSNRELQDANRLKSQFVANMSHEIRTPLNGIIGLSELAIRNASDPKQTDYVTKIRDAGTSLLGIINDILDFSKIEAGKLEFERTGFSLDKVLAGISDMFHSRAEAKSLGYSQTVDDDVPRYLVGDPLRLGQVLINLVGNAIKFTDRGSVSLTVRLRASESDQATVEFSVRDTGIGLQPSDQEKLFTSFSQADSSTTRKFGGTGLGLAISKQLVNLMGGEIEVTSELGAGSCFAFWAVFLVDSQKEAQRKVIPGILNELRVLVIVENPATKMRLKSLLGAYPFLCDFADSGKEALETIKTPQSSRYDLYLIEIWLSKMSGYDILRCLRSEPAQEKKPAAIMISSLGSRQDRDQSFLEGSDAFLAEPIASSSLSDAILRIFSPLLREAGPADRETAADQTVSQELRGKRILVVEDNEVNRQIVEEFVHSYGVETEVATNGKEAVEKILGGTAQTAYDLVLMDIQMPEMDGLTATRLIRQHPRFSKLPIVALSAHAMVEEHQKSRQAGMNDHLTKPIIPQKLFELLWRFLGPKAGTLNSAAGGTSVFESSPGFPSIVDVDTVGGLLRVAGNQTVYADLLARFAGQQGATLRQIRDGVQAGDLKTAERGAHSLRGLAANLGAQTVAEAATKLEAVLKKGEPDAVVDDLVDELELAFESVVSNIRRAISVSLTPN